MDANELLQGRTRETTIVRDNQGRWFHDGEPLEHANLVRCFEGWIERADDGRYCLKNDINWAYITLDGPPYFVRALHVDGDVARITLSGGAEEVLDARTLREGPDGALYCDVRDGQFVARFERHVQAQLEQHVNEDSAGVYLAIAGHRVRPKVVSEPLRASGEAR